MMMLMMMMMMIIIIIMITIIKKRQTLTILQWNPDFSNLLGKRKLVRKIEGGMKSHLIYEVLFYNNWESRKQKYQSTLVKFLAFI